MSPSVSVWTVLIGHREERNQPRPLHKDAGLHGVHDAPEARLVLAAAHRQHRLPREGGGQPLADLRRHRVRLEVTQLVLGVDKLPAQSERDRGSPRGGREYKLWRQKWKHHSDSQNSELSWKVLTWFAPRTETQGPGLHTPGSSSGRTQTPRPSPAVLPDIAACKHNHAHRHTPITTNPKIHFLKWSDTINNMCMQCFVCVCVLVCACVCVHYLMAAFSMASRSSGVGSSSARISS